MKIRKLHWEIPETWLYREAEDVEQKLTSQHIKDLQDVVDGFQPRGGLKARSHP
jgi:hypothetical protein